MQLPKTVQLGKRLDTAPVIVPDPSGSTVPFDSIVGDDGAVLTSPPVDTAPSPVSDIELDRLLDSLTDPSRRQIFRLAVAHGEQGVPRSTVIATQTDFTPENVAFHIAKLVDVGLLIRRKAGKFVFYVANQRLLSVLIDELSSYIRGGQT